MDTALFTFSLSIFDSLSTAQQIIIFALLLTTNKPVRNAMLFLSGLSGVYLICGLSGFLVIESLIFYINKFLPTTSNMSNPEYYRMELISGVVMILIGIWYFFKNRRPDPKKDQARNMLLARLKSMNAVFAFGIGAFISLTSFPFSIPYLIALGKYASDGLGFHEASAYIMLYNIGYALPMIFVLAVYLAAKRKTDDLHDSIHEKARMLNVHLTSWTFSGLGFFFMIDAGFYFTIGHALVRGRYL